MIRTFRCADTERLFRREAVRRFKSMERQGLRKLDMLDAAPSIRINDQWRLCFTWRGGNAHEVEIVDYH